MKISQMNNDQATNAIIKISQPIATIMDDPNAEGLFTELSEQKGKKPIEVLSSMLPKTVAFCMKDHKNELYEITAALLMVPVSEVGKMNFMQTVKELKDSIDEDFLSFFKSSGKAKVEPGKELS